MLHTMSNIRYWIWNSEYVTHHVKYALLNISEYVTHHVKYALLNISEYVTHHVKYALLNME